jgi:hypothetical protein
VALDDSDIPCLVILHFKISPRRKNSVSLVQWIDIHGTTLIKVMVVTLVLSKGQVSGRREETV